MINSLELILVRLLVNVNAPPARVDLCSPFEV